MGDRRLRSGMKRLGAGGATRHTLPIEERRPVLRMQEADGAQERRRRPPRLDGAVGDEQEREKEEGHPERPQRDQPEGEAREGAVRVAVALDRAVKGERQGRMALSCGRGAPRPASCVAPVGDEEEARGARLVVLEEGLATERGEEAGRDRGHERKQGREQHREGAHDAGGRVLAGPCHTERCARALLHEAAPTCK